MSMSRRCSRRVQRRAAHEIHQISAVVAARVQGQWVEVVPRDEGRPLWEVLFLHPKVPAQEHANERAGCPKFGRLLCRLGLERFRRPWHRKVPTARILATCRQFYHGIEARAQTTDARPLVISTEDDAVANP